MTWESDFSSQWQTLLDIVETNIRQEIKNTNRLTSEFINTVIQKEVAKWSLSNHYNGCWLNNLEGSFPPLGEEFRKTLEQLHLTTRVSFKKSPIIFSPAIITGGLLVLITFALLNQLDELITKLSLSFDFSLSLTQQILSTVLAALIILPIMKSLQEQKQEKEISQLIEKIQSDLNFHGNQLKEIAIKVDSVSE